MAPNKLYYVVDDDEDFREVARSMLAHLDPRAEVRCFETPAGAIQAMIECRPNLVVTDLIFPGTASGLDVLHSANKRGIPCMLCSEMADVIGTATVVSKSEAFENSRSLALSIGDAASVH